MATCTQASHEALKQLLTRWHMSTVPPEGYSDAQPALVDDGVDVIEIRNCRACFSSIAIVVGASEQPQQGEG